MKLLALVAVFLAATVTAGPVISSASDQYKCAGYCKGGSKLSYEAGSSYVYDYTADTVTSVSGAGTEESRLHLSATVEIHAVSQCDFTLQLSNVRLEDSSPTSSLDRSPVERLPEFAAALERESLLFAFQDGKINELCATQGEAPWVLNIKRGILSAFQNSMASLETDRQVFESDVTGDCETRYSAVYSDGTSALVKKSKNLLACAHRLDHFLSLQSTPYSSTSNTQSLPLVKSDHECYQNYRDGLLVLALCNESHMFRPFSNGDNGAVTRIVQNLMHQKTVVDGKPGKAAESVTRTTLLFEHALEENESTSRAQTIVAALEELEQKTADGVQSDVPRVFSQLVATLRTTSYPTLAKVFSHTRNQHTRKFLLDAMPLVGTADGLTVMTDLYENKEITEVEMDIWLTSLTFIKKPTHTMLLAVSSLMSAEPRPNAVLAISSMVHGYCQRDTACSEKEVVREIVGKMSKMLGDGCHVKGRKDMEQKIVALKGIGNAGVMPSKLDVSNNCYNCYKHAGNPMEIRLAAIRAYRRVPCSESRGPGLLNTYTDMQEDTELRIAAYLAVMQCPSSRILDKIKATLHTEEVNQVGSFVWTHLTNLQETSSRWKQSIRELISAESLRHKFQTDVRKFSRNYEGSVFFESVNAGATVESNIIFSSQSYLPRSAMLNLTMDIFGETINLFEVGSRAEGFEDVLEDMFGPEGYFPDKSLQQVLQKARGNFNDNDIENSIDQISSSFKAKSKLAKEPQASVYASVFGNEIHYASYQGLEEMLGGPMQLKNPLELFAKLFNGQEIDFTDSFVFLDASYKIPTIIGLPLDFSANGSATVGLKMNGHLDTRNLWRTGAAEIEGKIIPSAAVRVTGTMTIDAFVTKSGLETVSTLHTNTYLGGKVSVKRDSVDVKLDVPREKVDFLEVTSRMFVLRRNEAIEVEGILKDKEGFSDCTSETMSKIMGISLCSSLSYANASLHLEAPSYPLTGPLVLRIQMLKTDTFDSYVLNLQSKRQQDTEIRVFKFDTPNSQIDRKLETYLSFNQAKMAFVGKILSPFIKLEVDGKIDYNDHSKAVSVALRKNDVEMLNTRVGLLTTLKGHVIKYEPSMVLAVPKTVSIELLGNVYYVEGAKYSADFTLKGLTKDPLHFSADVISEGNKHEIVGLIKSPIIEGSVHANLRQTNSYVSTKITLEYALRQATVESINLSAKIQSNRKGDFNKYSAYGSLQMSATPQYNVLLSWDLIRSGYSLEHNARFGLGPTEWQTKQMYRNTARGSDDNFVAFCQFSCPSKKVDYKVDLEYKTSATSFKTHALAQINPQHRFFTTFNYVFADSNRELYAEVTSPWYSTSLSGEILETEPLHYAAKIIGKHTDNEASTTKNITLSSVYVDAGSSTHVDKSLIAELSGELKAIFQGSVAASMQKINLWVEFLNAENSKKYRADVTYAKARVHVVEATILLDDRTYRSIISLQNEDNIKFLDIDLQLSKRINFAIKAESDRNVQQYEVKFFWDKDANPDRRIALAATVSENKQSALLEFPGQYIRAELNTLPSSANGFLEWAPDQKIATELEWNWTETGAAAAASLTTPFVGLEAQSLAGGYYGNGINVTLDAKLMWQKQSVELNLVGGQLSATGSTFGAEIHVTSTIPTIADIYLDLKHTFRPEITSCFYIVEYNRQKVIDASWQTQRSVVTAELSYVTVVKAWPSINGKLNSSKGNLTLKLNYGTNGALLIEMLSNPDKSIAGYLELTTPFETFENTSAKWYSSITTNQYGFDFKVEADLLHNGNTSSLSLSTSKLQNFVVGSGMIKTPFTKSFEAGFTHSTASKTYKEGFSIAMDGNQLILASLTGNVHSLGNFTLATDLTTPTQTITTVFKNRLNGSQFESFARGAWNSDWLMGSLKLERTKKMGRLIATASGSILNKELVLEMEHNQETDGSYLTKLTLPGEISASHELHIKDPLNWENVIVLKSSGKFGQIANKQSFEYNALEFSHDMLVDVDGSPANASLKYNLDANLNIVRKAEGVVITPWTHPIKMFLDLPINDTTIQPKLKLQYNFDKEISVESLIFHQSRQSRFDLEIKSPYCKPITVKAYYDISLPTKAVLITFRWEDKQMDLKSTVHMEANKAMGVLVATRSDIDGPIVNGQFKYDVSKTKDMSAQISLLYREKKVDVNLAGGLSRDSWKAKCDLITPIPKWEKLTALFDVNLSEDKKTADVLVARNSESVSLSGTGMMNYRTSVLSLAVTSTVPAVKSFSMYSAIDQAPSDQNLEVICSFTYDTSKAELKGKAQLHDEGLAEVTLTMPVEGFEILSGQVRYNFEKSTEKSWAIVVNKNDLKVKMEGNLLVEDGGGETRVKFTSPFEGLESLDAYLRHLYIYTEEEDTLKTSIVVQRNQEIVEMTTSFVTSETGLSSRIECRTPIVGYKTLEGSVFMDGKSDVKIVTIALSKEEIQLDVAAEIDTTDLRNLNAKFQATSTFKYATDISATISYDLRENSEVSLVAQFQGFENEVRINMNSSRVSGETNLGVNVNLPALNIIPLKVSVNYLNGQSIDIQGEMGDQFVVFNAKLQDYDVIATILTPYKGFEKMDFKSSLEMDMEASTYFATINVKSDKANGMISVFTNLDPLSPEIRITIIAPVGSREKLIINGKYDVSNLKKSVSLVVTKTSEKYEASVEWFSSGREGEWTAVLNSPIHNYETLKINAVYNLKKDLHARITLQNKNDKLEGTLMASHSDVKLSLETPWKDFKFFAIAGQYQDVLGGKKISLLAERNKDKSLLEVTVKKNKDITTIFLNTPFNICRTFSLSMSLTGTVPNKAISLSIAKNSLELLDILGEFYLDTKSHLGFNVTIASPEFPPGYSRISVGSQYHIERKQKSLEFHVTRDSITVISSDFKLLYGKDGELTGTSSVAGTFKSMDKCHLLVRYVPNEMTVSSAWTTLKGNNAENFFASFSLKKTSLEVNLSSPVKGYENFYLLYKNENNALLVDFNTTFLYYDRIKLDGQINLLKATENSISLSMIKDEEVITADWKLLLDNLYMKSSIAINTPFESHRKHFLSVEYDLHGKNKAGIISVQKNNYTAKIESILHLQEKLLAEASLNLTTSGKHFDNIKFYGSYDLKDSSKTHLVLIGHWNDDWQVNIKFLLEKASSLVRRIQVFSMTPYSPTFNLTGSYDFSSPSKMQRIDAHINVLDIELSFSSIIENHWKQGKIEGRCCKKDMATGSKMKWTLVNEKQEKGMHAVLDFGENRNTDVTFYVKTNGFKNVSSSFNFVDFSSKSYDFETYWNVLESNAVSMFRYQWDTGKQITIESKLKFSPGSVLTNIKLSTPFNGLKKANFDGKWFVSTDHYDVKSILQFEEKQPISLVLELTMSTFLFSLQTPISEPFILSINHVHSDTNVAPFSKVTSESIKTNVQYGVWLAQVGVDLKFYAKGRTVVDITATTPIEGISHLHLEGDVTINEMIAKLVLEKEESKFGLEMSLLPTDMQNEATLNIVVTTPYKDMEEIKIYAMYNLISGARAQILTYQNQEEVIAIAVTIVPNILSFEVTTPIEWLGTLLVKAEADLNKPISQIYFDVKFADKRATLQSSLDKTNDKVTVIDIKVTSSWTEELVLSTTYDHHTNNRLTLDGVYGTGGPIEISGEVNLISDKKNLELTLESSIDGLGDFTLKTGYDWRDQEKKAHFSAAVGETSMYIRAAGIVGENGISGDVFIDTPLAAYKLIEVKVQIDKNARAAQTGSLALRVNTNVYELRYSSAFTANSLDGHLTIATPTFKIDNAILNLKHDKNFVFLILGINDKTLEFKGSYQLEREVSFLKAKLSIPFVKSLEHLEISFERNLQEEVFKCTMQWTQSDQIIFAVHYNTANFELSLATPFEKITTLLLTCKFTGDNISKNVIGKAVWNKAKIDMDGKMTLRPFDVDVSSQAEWGNGQVASTRAKFSAAEGKSSGHILATIQDKEINLAGEIDTADLSNVIVKLNIEMPFFDVTPITALAQLKTQDNGKELLFQANFPKAMYKIQANYILNNLNLKMGLDFDMPILKSNFLVGGALINNGTNEVDGNIYVNDNKMSASFKLQDKVITSSFDLNAPFLSISDARIDIQASTELSPDLHFSVTYRVGKHFGTMTSSILTSKKAFSIRLDLDLPQHLGPLVHTMRFSAVYPGPHYSVEVRYDDGRSTRSSSLEIDTETDWTLLGRATGPAIDTKEISFLLVKNWSLLKINVLDLVVIEAKHDQFSGSFLADCFGKEHKLGYGIVHENDGLGAFLLLESPALKAKEMRLSLSYKSNNDNFEAEANFASGSLVNQVAIKFNNLLQDKKSVELNIVKSSQDILNFFVSSDSKNDMVENKIHLDYSDSPTFIVSLKHRTRWPLDVDLQVSSTYLPENFVEAKLNIQDRAVSAYLGIGKKANNKFMSLVANFDPDEKNASVEFLAPFFNAINKLKLSGVCKIFGENYSMISFNGEFSSYIVPKAQISFGFFLSAVGIDTSFIVSTRLDNYESFKVAVQIPFVFSNNFDLNLSINFLQEINYVIKAKFHNEIDQIDMGLLVEYKTEKLGADIKVVYDPVPALEISLNTSLRRFRNYRIQLRGQKSIREGDDIINFIEYNDKRIEIRHSTIARPKKALYRIQITTPFRGYERYVAGFEYDFNQHKKALVTVGFPGLAEDWMIDFDFHYNNHRDLSFMTLIQAPIFTGFKVASFMIGNKLDGNRYRGVVTGRYNEKELSITLDSALEESLINGEMKAQLNEHKLRLKVDYRIGEQLTVNGTIQVETPFKFMENAQVSGRIAPFDPNVMQVKVVYNSAEILDASLNIDKRNIRKVQVINPWRPVYVAYSFLYGEDISIWGEVCWDMKKMETSKFGGGFSLFNLPAGRKEITAMMKLPTRDISFNGTRQIASSKKEYSMVLSWDVQQTLGYTFILEKPSDTKWNSLIHLDFPFRSFEVSSHGEQSSSKHADFGIQLMWDAAANRNKKASVNFMRSPNNAELTLQHFALQDNLVLRIEHSEPVYWITPIDGEPRNLNIAFEYSTRPQDLVLFGIVIFKFAERLDSYFVAKHEVSNINYQINLKSTQNTEEMTTDLGINYLDTSGLKQTLGIYGKVGCRNPMIEIVAKTSENTLSLNCSLWSRVRGPIGFTASVGMNRKEPLTIEGRVNLIDEQSFELDFGYGISRKYLLSMKMLSSRHISAEIQHTIYGIPSIDGQFNLRLNTSRHIWSKVIWTQNVLGKMKEAVFREYSDVRLVAENIVVGFVEFADQDFIGQLEAVHDAINNATAQVGLLTDKEINLVLEDCTAMSNLFGEMYSDNDFYMKDIHQYIKKSIAYAHEKASCLAKQLLDVFSAACSAVKNFAVHIAEALSIDLNKLADSFKKLQVIGRSVIETTSKLLEEMKVLSRQMRTVGKSLLVAVRDAVVEFDALTERTLANAEQISIRLVAHYSRVMNMIINSVQQHTILLHNSIIAIDRSINELVATVQITIMSVKEVQELVTLYNKYSSWLAEFSVHKYIDEVIEYLTIVAETLVQDFHRMFEDYKEYIDAASSTVSGHLENVNQVPSVAFAKHIMETISQKLAWVWKYNEMSIELKWVLNAIVESTNKLVMNLAQELDEENEFETQLESKMIVTGDYIEISQNLPVDWNSFLELPKFSQLTENNASISNEIKLDKFSNYLTAAKTEILTSFLDTSKYLPPFGTTGMILGRGHFITFDKKFFDFEGECSYLLASDLIDNTFSVVVHYHKEDGKVNRKSLTVLSAGHQIEILPNYRVTVDGISTDLPVFLEQAVEVTRNGHTITVSYQNQMNVECNLYHDICTVQLSGWYLGKVGGLLGSFDNEPANDMDLPNGKRATDLSKFAEGWRVGNGGQCHSPALVKPVQEDTSAAKLCTAQFAHRKSPLAACFGPLEPEPFLALCLSDASAGLGKCPSVIAYSLQCAKAGINVQIPQDCVQCNFPNSQDLFVGESKILDGSEVSSADVVFVIEKGSCVEHVDLVTLATKLDNTMIQQGLTENQFAIVSFNGGVFLPHLRTVKGSIWMNARSLGKALHGLHPVNAPLRRYPYDNEVYDALDVASQLPFRAGVSKTVVLVQCSGCSLELDQPQMLRQLVNRDVTLHVMQPKAVQMRGATAQRSKGKVFGTDANGVFTARNVKSIVPSGGLLREITLEKDSCLPLALQTNGTVFNLERLTEAKKQQTSAKKFIDVWSRRVAKTAKPAGCQKCDCIADKDGVGQIQCQRCSLPSVDQLLMDWESMMAEDSALPAELQVDNSSDEKFEI